MTPEGVTGEEATRESPRLLYLLLRVALGLLLLALAIRFAIPDEARNFRALAAAWTSPLAVAATCFALACVCFGVNFAVGALRFVGLLRGAGLQASWARVYRAYIVAGFASVVLPAGFGDAYRFADARRDTGRGGEVLGVVVLERLLSLAALGGIVLLALPFLPPAAAQLRGLLVGVAGLCVLAPLVPLHRSGRALLSRALPLVGAASVRLARAAERALDATERLSARPGVLLRALALSFVMFALPVAAVCLLAMPLDEDVSWVWFALIVPVVTLIGLIPVSLAGIGVREYLYIALFGAVGMRPEVALALSLSTFGVTMFWGIIGLALFMAGRGKPAPVETRA